MSTNPIDYLPLASTVVAASFTVVLWRHWRSKPDARYLLWWMIGVALYGVGTSTEALTTLFGWNEIVFRAWYVSGALLGGAPLAQGTVYLLLPRRKADRLAVWLFTYVAMATSLVVASPIVREAVEEHHLSGDVLGWQWVRLLSPVINLYAVTFLVGGAIWSAWRYRSQPGARWRVWGNAVIATGAILPGIGGGFARFGMVRVLYVTELVGLSLIWAGYRLIVGDRGESVHRAQRETTGMTPEMIT
ncbi:MAG TPA: hypothetical protein VGC47_02425 [Acidimicrobiia bacterium]